MILFYYHGLIKGTQSLLNLSCCLKEATIYMHLGLQVTFLVCCGCELD